MKSECAAIDALLDEKRRFAPPPGFVARARVADPAVYAEAEDWEAYWERWARRLHWFSPWSTALEWSPPDARWFQEGTLNACYNCIDRHLPEGAGRTALLWEGEPGDRRRFTYGELATEVERFAGVLKSVGVGRGDRVAIYLPMIPEAVFAMLACARIGAPHSVVFAGFSPDSLADRINDAGAEVLVTADGGYRRGKVIALKRNADWAAARCPGLRSVVVVRRGQGVGSDGVEMTAGRDHWYHELAQSVRDGCSAEPMGAEDLLYILYTSGTTGKPKGVVHTTGGYMTQVYATTRTVLDLRQDDVYWCTADVGWVTGHSYVVYGPLAAGAAVVIYEGAPDWPDRGRFWEICERYGVSVFYTAPTAIRAFMQWGDEWPAARELGSIRLLGTVGEPINPEAWIWYRRAIGGDRCPVVDTWWQTETGAMMISPLPGVTHARPGSACRPLPGIDVDLLNDGGESVKAGYLAITRPWPSMLRGIWGDRPRFLETYWSKWDGVYFAGDGAKVDDDGYLWLLGRVDDVLNVAGHRIGTMEVESALVEHEAVAEAAVVGVEHPVKGQGIAAFVTLMEGREGSDELAAELRGHVADSIGAIARPEVVLFAADLPKTRSGKIMRRLLGDIAAGRAIGDTTTLAEPAVVRGLQERYREAEGG